MPKGWMHSAALRFSLPLLWACLLLVSFAQAEDEAREYAIPAGPLDTVLSKFAAGSGVVLSFDAALTQGESSPGLNGRYTVAQGFSALLSAQWLEAERTVSGYRLKRVQARGEIMPTVTVAAKHDPVYETVGSVAAITREDIERLPPRNTADLFAAMPGVMTSNDRQHP